MKPNFQRFLALCLMAMTAYLTAEGAQAATDSYRFLHVTIETPWAIFLFLLVFIMIPFILMAMLYWHFAFKKTKEESAAGATPPQKHSE